MVTKARLFKTILFAAALLQFSTIQSQTKKSIDLKDIWSSRVFNSEVVNGMNPVADGRNYAVIDDEGINVFDFESGSLVKNVVNHKELISDSTKEPIKPRSYTLSNDETKILIPTETELIYRHSTKSVFYVYDIIKKALTPLSIHGKQQLATFSPDGSMIAFVRENNIFIVFLETGEEKQITFDGKINEIINGTTDWVYEEEFSFTQAFFWSGDSKKIAYYRFDESKVKEFQMTYYNDLYPEQYRFKYPKAGEDNSLLSIHVYNLSTDGTIKLDIGQETDIYIPRIGWTQDANLLSIQRLNRHQNHLQILLTNAETGFSTLLYEEKNPYYIDITDNLSFLPDGKSFIISSEKDGYNHIYHYDLTGKLIHQLTKGKWDVTDIYGYSSKFKKIYFQSAEVSPMDRNIYAVDLKGKKEQLISLPGQNSASFSSDYSYFINSNSTLNQPYYITVNKNTGKEVRVLKDNKILKETLSNYQWTNFSFFTINDSSTKLPDGTQVHLNGWQLLPPDFDSTKQYPVLLYIYGGPGAQTVNNSWGGANSLWFQLLAQSGIIVISIDNRGTGARGELFKKMTYKELGKYETEDLITTARYLKNLNYVNADKIGVFGWSYGGYMSSLAITKGSDYFQYAIAVAPVTSWRYYDNIYTERYMRTPIENPDGYDQNSPINHVEKIKGDFLLIHGSGDDNVHYQNTMEMINALVNANKPFELMIYPNKNHGIYGGNTRLHLYEKMTNFIKKSILSK